MPTEPRVSIGLPVYNGEAYLRPAIESLLGQTYSDFELILSDNASTDDTESICRAYARDDARIRYIRQPTNIGANRNFNFVVHAARGEYFKWSAHDDVVDPRYLEETSKVLDADPDTVLCHSLVAFIDEDGARLVPDGPVLRTSKGEHFNPPDKPLRDRQVDSPRPSARFRDVLLHSRWCVEVFGLVRREGLLQTSLQRPFYGTDKVILAELALIGKWRAVDEVLWFRRCHSAASIELPVQEKARWSDPSARRPIVPAAAKVFAGYVDAAATFPLPRSERIGAFKAAALLAVQPDKFRKAFLPGHYNYFGITGRRRHA